MQYVWVRICGSYLQSYLTDKYPSYPTVAILIEDLRRQRVAFLRLLVSGDVTVHPEPLLLQHGDVYFLEADSIGLQETHHCLLVLLYLERSKMDKKIREKGEVGLVLGRCRDGQVDKDGFVY